MMDVERTIKYISRSTLEMTEILPLVFFLVAGPLIRQSFLNIFFLGILKEESSSFHHICTFVGSFLLVVLFDW